MGDTADAAAGPAPVDPTARKDDPERAARIAREAVHGAYEFRLEDAKPFLRGLYKAVLGRRPDLGGLDGLVAQLEAGDTPREILATFLLSPEHKRKGGLAEFADRLARADVVPVERPDDPFATARALLGEGRIEDAVAEYGRLATAGIDAPVALAESAFLNLQLGRFSRMTIDFERAQAIARDDPYPWMRQGHIARSMRRPLFAIDCFRTALALAPGANQIEMRVQLVDTLLRLGWLDEARRHAPLIPVEVTDWWVAARHNAFERHRRTHGELRAVLARRRAAGGQLSRTDWIGLARGLFALGRLAAARRVCERLIAAEPGDREPYWIAADVIARQAGAGAALTFLLSAPPAAVRASDDWTLAVMRLHHDSGRFAAVIELARAQGVDDLNGDFRSIAGVAFMALEDGAALAAAARVWLAKDPISVDAAAFLISAATVIAPPRPGRAVPAAARRLQVMRYWNDPVVPPDVLDCIATWQHHNPDLETVIFHQAKAAAFIAAQGWPDVPAAFALCRHPAMQADLFRLAFLAARGGLYADVDEECLGNLGALPARAAAAEFTAVRSGELPDFVHNYFLGAHPGSRTMQLALDMATATILDAEQRQLRADIWHVTGPGLVTRALGHTLIERLDAVMAGELLLLPPQLYRGSVRLADDLAYKKQPAKNWRVG